MGEDAAAPREEELSSLPPAGGEALAALIPLLDDAPTPSWTPPKRDGWTKLAILAMAALIFLPNLGAFGLWDPWETHYGAVTTNMVETYDWVSPWWGYKEKIGTEPQQGKPFFSKPIFIFWTEATMARIFGRGEWAIRLPMALLAILAVFLTYITLRRIWSWRVGVLGAVIMATSPEFFMISRQAQTDMPFVGTLLIALLLFMMALFAPAREVSARRFWVAVWGTLVGVYAAVVPQLAIIATDLDPTPPTDLHGLKLLGWSVTHVGLTQSILFGAVLVGVTLWYAAILVRDLRREGLTFPVKDRWMRRLLLVGFYVMAAESTYAKGLLGFMLPGAIALLYLIVSNTWRSLARYEIHRGSLVFIAVGFPWYIAMFAKHGMAYYQRFFIHDHFNRLGAGVHQIDSGNFEHFIKWLGIGLFPWAAFVPIVLVWAARLRAGRRTPQNQAAVFLAVWFFFSFSFFTLSSTKFHHYIFPAMPALAMLTAIALWDLIDDRGWLARATTLIAGLFFVGLAWDLHEDPQHLRNLMTYKYDRPLPAYQPIDADAPVARGSEITWKDSVFWRHTSPTLHSILTTRAFRYTTFMRFLTVLGLVGLGLFFVVRTRKAGLVALGALASLLAVWSLNYYMPALSPHWSQKYLFDAYYDTCTRVPNPPEVEEAYEPWLAKMGLEGVARYFRYHNKRVCREDVISWLITWRGETYYSYNEIQPITKEKPQFMPYLEERNHGQTFYALMERGKKGGFKSKLESYTKKLRRKGLAGWKDIKSWKIDVVNDESQYFQMIRATPVRG